MKLFKFWKKKPDPFYELEEYANGYADVIYKVDELLEFSAARNYDACSHIYAYMEEWEKDVAFFYLVEKCRKPLEPDNEIV
jgi:hypothetical protein